MKLDINKAFILVTVITEKGNSITLPCRKYSFSKRNGESELNLNSAMDDGVTPCEGVKEYYRKNPTAPVGTEVLLNMLLAEGIALVYNTATLMYNEQGELFIPEEE